MVALDVDRELLSVLRRNPLASGIATYQSDATQLPLRALSCDAAILIEVLEHIDDTESVLSEVCRVLKPHGLLRISIPTAFTERIYSRLHPSYNTNAGHLKVFDRHELVHILEESGFHVNSVLTTNFEPAISWVFHALLRSRADHTGKIYEHLWIDTILSFCFRVWRRIPVLRATYFAAQRRVGKSWYLYCEKT